MSNLEPLIFLWYTRSQGARSGSAEPAPPFPNLQTNTRSGLG